VRTPTLVIEGVRGNANVFPLLKNAKESAPIDFALIPKANHYNILAPVSAALAAQIAADTGAAPRFKLDLGALARDIAADEE
jgi:hypothetical protein